LSIAALPTKRFAFEGFLPAKPSARRAALERLREETRTLVFYEAPHRLQVTLRDLAELFGAERAAAIGRELTKKFETTYRGTLADLARRCEADSDMARGELVLVISGAKAEADAAVAQRQREGDRVLRTLLQELPVSQAARIAAQLTQQGRKELYERALQLVEQGTGDRS
jgi:16S rRNA (cytidine1402-2'-O)-methyltransferase